MSRILEGCRYWLNYMFFKPRSLVARLTDCTWFPEILTHNLGKRGAVGRDMGYSHFCGWAQESVQNHDHLSGRGGLNLVDPRCRQ